MYHILNMLTGPTSTVPSIDNKPSSVTASDVLVNVVIRQTIEADGYNFNTNAETKDTIYKGSQFKAIKIPGDGYQLFGPGNLIYFVDGQIAEEVEDDNDNHLFELGVFAFGLTILFYLINYVGKNNAG